MAKKSNLLEVLRTALQTEHYGHWFYSMAASQCQDQKGKEVFSKLARDELEHVGFLRAQARALEESGQLDRNLQLGQSRLGENPGPIFSPEIRNRLSDAHYEMTALAVGLELEGSARDYYRRQAKKTRDELARAFFEKLADWENGHYQALAAQQKELQEDYWQQAGFAPF